MVRHSQPRISIVALSWRGFLARSALGFFLILSLALFILNKAHSDGVSRARFVAVDVLSAVTQAVAKPADAVHAAANFINDWFGVREENYQLRQENAKLKQWQTIATQLGNENIKLRGLMNAAPPGRQFFISARVSMGGEGPFGQSAVIDAGSEQGVKNDFAVTDENGLIGRVLEAGAKSARVLLVTDSNSRIPVMTEISRERAIAAGDNSGTLRLLYLPEKSALTVGERIVTTFDGGVLPAGLAVGEVTKIENGVATVQPLLDVNRLEYVSVVDLEK